MTPWRARCLKHDRVLGVGSLSEIGTQELNHHLATDGDCRSTRERIGPDDAEAPTDRVATDGGQRLVYITDNPNRHDTPAFHNDEDCYHLRRTAPVQSLPLAEVGDREECTDCALDSETIEVCPECGTTDYHARARHHDDVAGTGGARYRCSKGHGFDEPGIKARNATVGISSPHVQSLEDADPDEIATDGGEQDV